MVVTASEAAKLLRTRTDIVLRMVETGELPAYREGRNWKIPKTLLQAYIEDRAMRESKERRNANDI